MRQLRTLLLFLLFGLSATVPARATNVVEVPREMEYCGIWLTFTPAARQKIQEYVNQYTKNYVSYRAMVDRAATYMPFIRDGFSVVGVPTDLAYIAIQESGLRGGVVSTSNAVGFWQMKDYTAREVGLRVDEWIDERKHIFRASIGAARYFLKNGQRYNNWLYAIVSYYEGGTGARPYTQERYIGAHEMEIDADFHWYALKAIAHKLAYEEAIRALHQPTTFLAPFSNDGELDVAQLAGRHGISLEKFREYNLWAGGNTLPPDRPFSYHIPAEDRSIAQIDPLRHLWVPTQQFATGPTPNPSLNQTPSRNPNGQPTQAPVLAETQTHPTSIREQSSDRPIADIRANVMPAPPVPHNAIRYSIIKEEMMNIDFVVLKEGETLERISARTHVPVERLRKWNNLFGDRQPPAGTLLAIRKPRKVTVHVAGERETLVDVAFRYRRNPRKLAYLNRLNHIDQLLLPGQKIYLVDRRPATQPLILYNVPDSLVGRAPAPAARTIGSATGTPRTSSVPQPRELPPPPPAPRVTTPQPSAAQPAANHTTSNPAPRQATSSAANTPAPQPVTNPAPRPSTPSAVNTPAPQPVTNPVPRPATPSAVNTPAPQPVTNPAPRPVTPPAVNTPAPQPVTNPTPRPTDDAPLTMPSPERATSPAPVLTPAAQPSTSEDGFHTVAPSETLYSLSRRFGVTVEQLQQWNQLTGTSLSIGQRIRVRQP